MSFASSRPITGTRRWTPSERAFETCLELPSKMRKPAGCQLCVSDEPPCVFFCVADQWRTTFIEPALFALGSSCLRRVVDQKHVRGRHFHFLQIGKHRH